MVEISNRPYIIRAMFDWMVDNHWTPHLQVDANYPGISIPLEYAQDGVIVLNVHPDAVRELQLNNDWFYFKARFKGVEREIGFPPEAVLAIFARENGQGMPFPPEPYPEEEEVGHPVTTPTGNHGLSSVEGGKREKSGKSGKKSHLTVVK